MDVDAIHRISFRVSVLKKPTRADRVIEQTDATVETPATDETPHEGGDRVRREKLAEVLPSRRGQFALVSDRCSL
ncbi:hypothetical protein [Paraburkholderia diazotrophica]|uniref:hypothetical protein n=1 Tax=Paraburkholderia diazotrophica TaxID=667676 RepID=UPI001FEC6A83|nr:hypothetical protein [Paraburkholderia diazotrophica]